MQHKNTILAEVFKIMTVKLVNTMLNSQCKRENEVGTDSSKVPNFILVSKIGFKKIEMSSYTG